MSCADASFGVWSACLFEEDDDKAISVILARYVQILYTFKNRISRISEKMLQYGFNKMEQFLILQKING